MAIIPKSELQVSDGCDIIRIVDQSEYTGSSSKSAVRCRNWIVTNGCTGEILSTGHQAEVVCVDIEGPFLAGEVLSINYGPTTFSYTIKAADVVAESSTITASEAEAITRENLLNRLYELVKVLNSGDHVVVSYDLLCEPCGIRFISALPGIPLHLVVSTTSGGGSITATTVTPNVCNKRFRFRYSWSLSTVTALTLTSLPINGTEVIGTSLLCSGATAADLAADAAANLNSIPVVGAQSILFQSSGSTLFVYSTADIGTLGYTDQGGAKVLAPVLDLSETPEDGYMDIPVQRDQVICVRMYFAEAIPEYATAFFTLGTGHDDTSTFSISTTPALYGAPVVGNWQGSNADTAAQLVTEFNAYISEGTTINPLDLFAAVNPDIPEQVVLYVSMSYLSSLSLVPSDVSLNTPILSGAGTLGTTQLIFNDDVAARNAPYEDRICSPLVCRLSGQLSDTWVREYSSTCNTPNNCLPLSSKISSGLNAITDYVCRGLLCEADNLIQYLSGLSNHNKCRGC